MEAATITHWPETAGVTAAIQRSRLSAGPTMPKNACSAASSIARMSVNWPSSGIIYGCSAACCMRAALAVGGG